MTKSDIKWLAGIIDAEGCIDMRISPVNRGKYKTTVRTHRLRIKTCDDIIVPHAAALLGVKYNTLKHRTRRAHVLQICGTQLRNLLLIIIPYLCTKKLHAKICLEALTIKGGTPTRYSPLEQERWLLLFNNLKSLNKRGPNRYNDENDLDDSYVFSYEWLAGIIDGDGSVTSASFNSNTKKPFIKISMTSIKTIKLICNNLNLIYHITKPTNKKARLATVRMMSNAIVRELPKIMPFLKLKFAVAQLALKATLLRRNTINTNIGDPTTTLIINEMSKLNLHI